MVGSHSAVAVAGNSSVGCQEEAVAEAAKSHTAVDLGSCIAHFVREEAEEAMLQIVDFVR